MSLCSASVCGFFYSRCHFTKQKLGLTHGPDSRFMCCCNTLQTAVKLLFHFCFCFVAHGSEWCFHNPLSFGQLFFLLYFIFFGGGFGLASAPASPPVSSQQEAIFTKNSFSVSELLCRCICECSSITPQKCWESTLFSCTLGKVKASPCEREWIWTGFKKQKLQVYQEVSELFICYFAGIFFFFALVNESTDGIQTDVWDRALSSVWLIALCNNDGLLSKYSLLKSIVSAVQI